MGASQSAILTLFESWQSEFRHPEILCSQPVVLHALRHGIVVCAVHIRMRVFRYLLAHGVCITSCAVVLTPSRHLGL